jgi:hypothetical protein
VCILLSADRDDGVDLVHDGEPARLCRTSQLARRSVLEANDRRPIVGRRRKPGLEARLELPRVDAALRLVEHRPVDGYPVRVPLVVVVAATHEHHFPVAEQAVGQPGDECDDVGPQVGATIDRDARRHEVLGRSTFSSGQLARVWTYRPVDQISIEIAEIRARRHRPAAELSQCRTSPCRRVR